ncbi:hypothetical protein Tco_0083929 [Tanacetum coccineum]
MNSSTIVSKIHRTNSNGLRRPFQLLKISLTGINNDIYSTVDACPNACEIWKAIERIYKALGFVSKGMSETKTGKDATYHKEKMLLCKQEEAGFQLNAEQADWRDDTNDEPDD